MPIAVDTVIKHNNAFGTNIRIKSIDEWLIDREPDADIMREFNNNLFHPYTHPRQNVTLNSDWTGEDDRRY